MIAIPEELIDQFKRGNVLLFVGDHVLRDAQGVPIMDQIAAQLATRCTYENPEKCSFPEASQGYQDALGRQALIQFLRDRLEELGDETQAAHRLIASLAGCKVMATTCVDQYLERAFEDAGRPLDVIIGRADLPFQDERKARLYKLRGSIDRPESLVLTEDDHDEFFDDNDSLSVVLQGLLATKTILFVGYSLDDPDFKRFYQKATSSLDNLARRAYAFATATSPSIARWCQRHNVQLIDINAETFLQALVEQLQREVPAANTAVPGQTAPAAAPAIPLPQRPYKLLDHYGSADAAIFFGREQETQLLTARIHAHRTALLYGASGTGKTSLLLAGVLPRLEHASTPYGTAYVRLRGMADPAEAVRTAVGRSLAALGAGPQPAPPGAPSPGRTPPEGDAALGEGPSGRLVAFVADAARAAGRGLVLFLDQFEEFFMQYSPEARRKFIAELGEIYDASDVPAKLLFSLREDWLASMNELTDRIPGVFNVDMRLLPLARQQARQAITAPAEALGVTYEPALVEALLDDLTGMPDVAALAGAVMPPELQLVCDALYERASAQGRKRILMVDYNDLGRAQGVLTGYIEQTLQKHPAQDRKVARDILAALVTSQASRALLAADAIAAAVGADSATVERVLARLESQRLVRRLDDGSQYELAHDTLAASIAGWLGETDRQLKQVQELVRRELADWRQDPGMLLSQGKFARVNAMRESLRLTDEEAGFVARSALLYGAEVPYWLARAGAPARQVDILLETLAAQAAPARLHAAGALAEYPAEPAALALAHAALEDPEPAVRDVAAASLARMNGQAGLRVLVDAGMARDTRQRRQAIHALALVRDAAPQQRAHAPAPVNRQVSSELGRIRFMRDWPQIRLVTVVAAVGGAVAFALGLTPPTVLHTTALYRSPAGPADALFYALILGLLGLLAGAGLAFGSMALGAILGPQVRRGRILGGALFGALSFALALAPLTIADAAGPAASLAALVGSAAFGALTGLGITAGEAAFGKRAAWAGGALGAALGSLALDLSGFQPFQDVPVAVLIACAALLGLILAYSIGWAEERVGYNLPLARRSHNMSSVHETA